MTEEAIDDGNEQDSAEKNEEKKRHRREENRRAHSSIYASSHASFINRYHNIKITCRTRNAVLSIYEWFLSFSNRSKIIRAVDFFWQSRWNRRVSELYSAVSFPPVFDFFLTHWHSPSIGSVGVTMHFHQCKFDFAHERSRQLAMRMMVLYLVGTSRNRLCSLTDRQMSIRFLFKPVWARGH